MKMDGLQRQLGRSMLVAMAVGLFGGIWESAPATAAAFPDHPLTIIQPYPPGGSSDITLRRIAEKALPILGQPIVIQNKPGSSGIVAVSLVAKAKPDGYTLIFATTQTHVTNKAMYSDLPYDPIKDFAPVGVLWQSETVVVVNAKLPVTSLTELVAYAKARPGGVKFASTGAGSATQLGPVDFAARTGIKLTNVAYSNLGEAFQDLANGQISLMFYPFDSLKPLLDAGTIRALATTGTKREVALPNVPTAIEAGIPNFTNGSWNAIFAPAGTPPETIATLYKAFSQVVTMPEIRGDLEKEGGSIFLKSPGETPAFLQSEIDRITKIVDQAGAKVR